MTNLETIGNLYLKWLQSHRNTYAYHKAFIDMVTVEIKNEYGEYQEVFDEKPPEYKHRAWEENRRRYNQESEKAEQLYKDLLEQADLYIAKLKLGELNE